MREIESRYARVAVENTAYHFDKLFDYLLPDDLLGKVKPGCRVLVPFGGGNRKRQAVVFALAEETDMTGLKPVAALLDKEPAVSAELLELAKWIKANCFCTLFEAVKLMLPTGLNIRLVSTFKAAESLTLEQIDSFDELTYAERRILNYLVTSRESAEHDRLTELAGLSDKSDIPERLVEKGLLVRVDDAVRRTGDAVMRMVRLVPEAQPLPKPTPKQKQIIELLEQAGCASVKEICYFAGCTQAVVNGLCKHGITEYYDAEVYRRPDSPDSYRIKRNEIILTDEQEAAYRNMLERYHSGKASTTLLFGVTGSGKTSVFMRLIDDVAADGRGVIVMVPEIALTPQTLERFRSRYGEKIAVFHSGLSLGQRMDEWKRVKNGDAQIAIGTRSAVFAPFSDLGLIIIDEEQEYTYKSEASPRYHARDVARFRCAWHKAQTVLSSATPSMESYYFATEGKAYYLEKLEKRYGSAKLPEVEIIDISEQRLSENIISPQLRDAIKRSLDDGKQVILLHNRRGFNTFVSCRACGHVLTCKYCSVSMTYHHDSGRLVCHYCGMTMPFATECPDCGSKLLRYAGQGTQRAEDELAKLFPEAKILRMDADTTSTRSAYSERLAAFSRGDYDIMLGTQMVAKGLDFERVTLVGVLMADQMLFSDDFRSYERAFSLLTQVVGRSGRGEYSGRAIIQTLTPESPVFEMAAGQDYLQFYNNEIKIRRAMLYPPFSDICVIGFSGMEEAPVKNASLIFLERLKELAASDYSELPLRVLGPSPAAINRVKGRFRYKIIMKCRRSSRLRELLDALLHEVGVSRDFKDVQTFIDMNPDNVL